MVFRWGAVESRSSGLLAGNSWLGMIVRGRTRSTEYEFTPALRSTRYEDGTSCQTLERRQLPRSTRYHVQGRARELLDVGTRQKKLTFTLLNTIVKSFHLVVNGH